MANFIKLHVGLFHYLVNELKKKRTLKDLFKFLVSTVKVYLKELLRIYMNYFKLLDPKYRKQLDQVRKNQSTKVKLQTALKLLKYVDDQMIKQGKNRQERRAFWREFFKDGIVRADVFEKLAEELK